MDLDIKTIAERARDFRQTLRTAEQRIGNAGFVWYPYDTLATLVSSVRADPARLPGLATALEAHFAREEQLLMGALNELGQAGNIGNMDVVAEVNEELIAETLSIMLGLSSDGAGDVGQVPTAQRPRFDA